MSLGRNLWTLPSSVLGEWDAEKWQTLRWVWEFKDRNDLCPVWGGTKDVDSFPHALTVLGDKKHLCDVFSLSGQEIILPCFPQLEHYGNRRIFPTPLKMEQSIPKVLVVGIKWEHSSNTHGWTRWGRGEGVHGLFVFRSIPCLPLL